MTSIAARAADLLDPPDIDLGWHAQPKQQLASALADEADELLYGGAAGAGKTVWLIHHIVAELLRHPRNRGVIFRRVFPSLARTIVPHVRDLAPRVGGRYTDDDHILALPNGSVLELSHLERAKDVHRYQGAEYGVIGWEELTEFEQPQYEYLLGRLRAPVAGVRPHSVGTTNPGGVGHRWVKRRFIRPEAIDLDPADPPAPNRVWRPAATVENPDPLSRCFVPATMDDNPALMGRDPKYRNRLRANSSRAMRQALEHGDWDAVDAVEGALWLQSWLDEWRVIEAPLSRRRVLAVDPSDGEEQGDAYGVVVASLGGDGRGYVEHSDEWRASPAQLVRQTAELASDLRCDAVVVERNHGGKWLTTVFRQGAPNLKIKTVWASEGKRTRAEPVAGLFEPIDDEDAAGRRPRACLVGHHPELEGQLTTFTGGAGEPSPNLLDALVWALTELMPISVARTASW